MLKKAWNSPTLMTWMSYSTKALSLFGVLPLILKQFSAADIVLYYLFSTIVFLQSVADFGFRQTFTRIISYAFGGAKDIAVFSTTNTYKNSEQGTQPNVPLMGDIISTMKYIYLVLTAILFVAMTVFGTLSMIKPVADASNANQAWYCWVIILIVSCFNFYTKSYLNFLEGLNQIALVRRIETLTSIGSILSSMAVLYFAPTLLNLIIVSQFWVLIVSIRDWYLCTIINDGFYKKVSKRLPFNKVIFKKIWHPAWRSGIGGLMSAGVTNLTSIVYAQFGNTASVASYLLAIRIITQIKEVSMAPFYSKLPVLAIYRVNNDMVSLKAAIKRGMRLSHAVFIIGFIATSLLIGPLLRVIGSKTAFLDMNIWGLLGWAFYAQRFGAMHLQVYLTTNHVITHIADTVSGFLYIVAVYFLSKYIGVYAIPVGMLIGYLGFYSWYTTKFSYRSLNNTNFWQFERTVSVPFVAILIVFSALAFFKIF
ncbi:hypothetical protein [Mucilaginibacter glaciei]|uniref:O-antigen/teichoic acid export membrane protein n=1 Tax=Mucilaginibacter glaciei TaxID=2772109 RepID=A0A926NQ46_9SPHI|nr:hypothetical protein [Mucilaginibacter glaciei]MBD1393333.1 hypothetical protein [Mucilaginibacter glaciei]